MSPLLELFLLESISPSEVRFIMFSLSTSSVIRGYLDNFRKFANLKVAIKLDSRLLAYE